jgi:hypothetical protein
MSFRTIGEVISQVRNDLKQFTVDTRLTDRDIYAVMKSHSYWIIAQEADKMKISKQAHLFQSYTCAEIIPVPTIDPCCNIQSRCRIYRTKESLPGMFTDDSGQIIRTVTSVDWSENLQRTTFENFLRIQEDPDFKYNKTKYFFIRDNYMYFPTTQWRKINMLIYCDTDVSVYNKCNCSTDEGCKKMQDRIWRVPDKLEARILDAVINEFAKTYMRVTYDDNANKTPNK